eukprot:COSAG02_NODE_424_length_22575_cov_79.088361_8_plen_37_part_00
MEDGFPTRTFGGHGLHFFATTKGLIDTGSQRLTEQY